jgi:hypothetical protein
MLFHKWVVADISILLEETLSSRQETEEKLKNGTSINNPYLSDPDQTTNHSILFHQERVRIFKLVPPTQDGIRSSCTKDNISSIFKTRRQLMSIKIRILKDKMLSSGEDTTVPTRDGELPIKTNTRKKPVKDLTKSMDSISIEPSTSDPDCQ